MIKEAEVYNNIQDVHGGIKTQRQNAVPEDELPIALLFLWQPKIAHVDRTKALFLTQEK